MIGGQNFAQSLLCRLCVLTGLLAFAAHLPDSGNDFFETAVRSLSVPDPDDYRDHKCFTQVVSSLLITRENQLITGNGSNHYLTKFLVCCEGYKPYKHNDSLCVPDCKGKCRNGICQKPDICKCFQGFVKNEDDECVQTCPLGCLNGVCNFDGSCKCNYGFELDDTGKYCKPRCQQRCPLNMNCTRPGLCDCKKGYSRIHGDMCEPQCNPPCGNGYCKGPNMCECFAGYNLKNGVCQSPCNLVCGNGTCTSPHTCSCNPGFTLDRLSTSCIPKCVQPCPNGICVAPNFCKCFQGYKMVHGFCQPDCPRGCVRGRCLKPNYCHCDFGVVDKIGHCRYFGERWCSSASNGVCFAWSQNNIWHTSDADHRDVRRMNVNPMVDGRWREIENISYE